MSASKAAADAYRIGSTSTNTTAETSGLFSTGAAQVVPVHTNAAFGIQTGIQTSPQTEEKPKEVFLTGISTFGGLVKVFLSNGEVYTSADKDLQFVSRQMAIVNGKSYRFAPR